MHQTNTSGSSNQTPPPPSFIAAVDVSGKKAKKADKSMGDGVFQRGVGLVGLKSGMVVLQVLVQKL